MIMIDDGGSLLSCILFSGKRKARVLTVWLLFIIWLLVEQF